MPFFLRPLALLITGAVETKYLQPNLKTQFDFLESQLATSPDNGQYLCGATLTGADIMMSFPLGMYLLQLRICTCFIASHYNIPHKLLATLRASNRERLSFVSIPIFFLSLLSFLLMNA